jgi:hypothetical protein
MVGWQQRVGHEDEALFFIGTAEVRWSMRCLCVFGIARSDGGGLFRVRHHKKHSKSLREASDRKLLLMGPSFEGGPPRAEKSFIDGRLARKSTRYLRIKHGETKAGRAGPWILRQLRPLSHN